VRPKLIVQPSNLTPITSIVAKFDTRGTLGTGSRYEFGGPRHAEGYPSISVQPMQACSVGSSRFRSGCSRRALFALSAFYRRPFHASRHYVR
jgi:hypothetical protein